MSVKYDNESMKSVVHQHLGHLARVHIEKNNIQKASEALESVPDVSALEFLFKLASSYRADNLIEQTKTTLAVADMIKDRRKIF